MVFMYLFTSTATKTLTSDTTLSNYILIVDPYSKIPNNYGMQKITTEEVMDKLDVFQSIWEIDGFVRRDLERSSENAG